MSLSVRNWDKFQHYKARRPPWIKLHRGLLEDRAFLSLPLSAQALAPRLWLIASETEDGSLPDDPADLAFRLRCSEAEAVSAVNALIQNKFLSGSLDVASATLAPCVHVATPETEGETEGEERQIPPASPPALALVPVVTATDWNREAADDFKAVYGANPPQQFFAQVKPVAKQYGWARTRPALRAYMEETPIEFLNVAKCLSSKVANFGAQPRAAPASARARQRTDGMRALVEGGLKGDGTV